MDYNPALPNRFDENLIPVKIRASYFEEYLGLTPLTSFMGTSPQSAIQVFEMKSGEGTTYRVASRNELDYENPIMGFNQAAGAEQQVEILYDEIKIDLRRFVDQLMGTTLVKQMTPIDVYNTLRPLLLNVTRRNLVKSILDAATVDLYKPAFNGPSEHRCVYAGVVYKDKIADGVKEMKGATYEKSGLSVDHIRELKRLAISGGTSYEVEAKIRPVEIKTKRGFPEELYVYLMDTNAYQSLVKDPSWDKFVYRGVIQGEGQPEGLSGARYRGTVEGVMIYECPELARYRILGSDKKNTAAWNLFLGAQALDSVVTRLTPREKYRLFV